MERKSISCKEATQALSPDKERQLIEQAQVGNEYAFEKLLTEHQKCIQRAAKKFYCPSLPLDGTYSEQLEQVGKIGFWEAVVGKKLSHRKRGARFDVSRENRLWTYAWQRVDEAMRKACNKWNQVRDRAHRKRARVQVTQNQLWQKLRRKPSAKEIAATSGVKLDVVREVLSIGTREMSLDGTPNDGNGVITAEWIPTHERSPEEELIHQEELWEETQQRRQRFERVIEIFGPTVGKKFIVLFLLHESEEMGYIWRQIAKHLTKPSEEVARKWKETCKNLPLPAEVPCNWQEVCQLFNGQRLTHEALRKWYTRKHQVLLSAL